MRRKSTEAQRWRQLLDAWRPHIEPPIPEGDLTAQLLTASIPSFAFFLMLALATTIATFGLIANSAPAIIGAMIVAPLMSPIIGLSYGLVSFHRQMIAWSLFAVIAGSILVVAIAFVIAQLLGIRIVGSEILGRTAPTLIDLGVAMAAGAAAAFSYTRKSILSSLAGVAIAVALIPPLAVVGIGLAFGQSAGSETALSLSVFGLYRGGADVALGALILFLTNLVGIIAVAVVAFSSQRYGTWTRTAVALSLCIVVSALLIIPLQRAFDRMHLKSQLVEAIAEFRKKRPRVFTGEGRITAIRVAHIDGAAHVYVEFFAPRERFKDLQPAVDELSQKLSAANKEPVVVVFDMIGVDMLRAQSRNLPKSAKTPGR